MDRQEIEAAWDCALFIAKKHFPSKVDNIVLEFGRRSGACGYATYSTRTVTIDVDNLQKWYFNKEPDEEIHFDIAYELCIHEIAHLIAHAYGARHHDETWRWVMGKLGFEKANRFLEDSPTIAQSKSDAKNRIRIGQAVSWCYKEDDVVIGTVVRKNEKTFSVVTDDGQRWRVSYGFAGVEIL